jgi:predicted nucleotidyltransferase
LSARDLITFPGEVSALNSFMNRTPVFPTRLHRDTAGLIKDFFKTNTNVDTILMVNSCARGTAVPASDLDLAVLVKPGTPVNEIETLNSSWLSYLATEPIFLKFKQSSPFAHIHLDIINGIYTPGILEPGGPIDYFEIEIGNQICYSAPMTNAGNYFQELQNKWLPYYENELRLERMKIITSSCNYNLDHVPLLTARGLHFHAFDILYRAFQEYLQILFMANQTYPIAYNKWIKEQIVKWLGRPELYPKLSPILSVHNIESNQVNDNAKMLRELLNLLTDVQH